MPAIAPTLHESGQEESSLARVQSRTRFVAAFLACVGLCTILAMALANRDSWGVDFNQFFVAGKLVGTGHLYDWPASQALQLQNNSKAVPYLRFPFFALIVKPIAFLPYPLARALFLLTELAALAGFAALWPFPRAKSWPWVWTAICWSMPASVCLAFGQDSIFFLFFMALGCWLLLRRRDFTAGLALSMCAAKPHIAAIIPVILVAQSRWKALYGAVAGGFVIAVASFAAEGLDWPAHLAALRTLPDFERAFNRMPNLRGLLTFFDAGLAVEIALSLAIAAIVFLLSRRISTRLAMTIALSGGLLLSHHAYVYDCVLLIPGLLLPFEEPNPEWLRIWALLCLTPLPYMLILTDIGLPGHLAITGYTIALILTLAWSVRRSRAMIP